MKIIKGLLLLLVVYFGIYFIYPLTQSVLFVIFWSLAIIFGLFNLEKVFMNRLIYLVVASIVFGIFLGSAFFVVDHGLNLSSGSIVDTVNVFFPLIVYLGSFKRFKNLVSSKYDSG